VDVWAAKQSDKPARPEAILRLVELGLETTHRRESAPNRAAKASEMAPQPGIADAASSSQSLRHSMEVRSGEPRPECLRHNRPRNAVMRKRSLQEIAAAKSFHSYASCIRRRG
jgi:hypothetical protein